MWTWRATRSESWSRGTPSPATATIWLSANSDRSVVLVEPVFVVDSSAIGVHFEVLYFLLLSADFFSFVTLSFGVSVVPRVEGEEELRC